MNEGILGLGKPVSHVWHVHVFSKIGLDECLTENWIDWMNTYDFDLVDRVG